MELFTKGNNVKLRSHLDKFLVADDDKETIRQSRKGDSRRAVWTVEPVVDKPNLIRLKSSHGTYLTASNKPLLLGMTGEKVIQTASFNKLMDWQTQWEPERDGFQVKLKSWCGKWLRANGGTPPWRNSVTHDEPHTSKTKNWLIWDVITVDGSDLETMSDGDESSVSSPVSEFGSEPGSPGSAGSRKSFGRFASLGLPMSPRWSPKPKEDERQFHETGKGSKFVYWGYEVNTSSDDCIAAINSYSHQVLGYGRDRKVILQAPLYDKDCVLGNILAARYLSSSDFARANSYVRAAQSHLGKATPYEKAVFEAVNYLISANMDDNVALDLHSMLLKKFPKDLLSWKRVEILCFYMGRPDLSLPLFEKILPDNREQDYVYGMLAFPLLELGHLADAEKAARKGYEINKNDSWAHHCLCHVLQTECRFKEAVEFMEGCSASWDSCSSLRFSHNWWHVAVCYLEGGSPISKVQEIYDHQMCKELEKEDAVATDVYMDALGLLLRLDTRDKLDQCLDRLKVLANCLTDQAMWYQEWLFDITIIWALSKVGNTSQAHVLLEGLKSRTSDMNKKKQQLMQKAIVLAEAVYEYGKGSYKEALELLGPDFDAADYKVIGASGLQIDVFNEIWYKMLLLTGQSSTAIQELEKRIQQSDGAPFLWRLLEKSYAMEGKTEAISVGEKAKALEASYFKFA